MGANLLQTLYNLADTYFLGRIGKEAVSAPSIAFNIIFFLIVFGAGFSAAGTTLISQAKGTCNTEKVNFYVGQMLGILLVVSIIITAMGIGLTDVLLRLMQVPEGLTYDYTREYMRIIFLGMPCMFIVFAFQGIMQGVGNSLTPLLIQIVTVLVNVILDILLIFGLWIFPELGVAGAAIATVAARGLTSVIAIYILIRGKRGIKLKLHNLIPAKAAWRRIVSIGLPSSLGQGFSALGFTTLQGVVNTFGPAVIAAFGISVRILALFNMPGQGISQATAVIVGQSLGAKDYDSASRTVTYGLITIGAFIIPGMSLTFFYGNQFIRFFVNDPEVISYGAALFRIVSSSVVLFALFTVMAGAFQGGGDTKPIMGLNMFRLWGVRVPVALLLTRFLDFGPAGIWWAMFLSNLVVVIIICFLYRTDRWKYKLNPDTI